MPAGNICKCITHGCNSKTYVNRAGATCSGALVSRNEYATHKKEDKAMQRHDLEASRSVLSDVQAPHHIVTEDARDSIHSNAQLPGEEESNLELAQAPSIDNGQDNRTHLVARLATGVLDDVKMELETRRRAFSCLQALVFTEKSHVNASARPANIDVMEPQSSGVSASRLSRMPNSGPLQLKYSAPGNTMFLSYERWIAERGARSSRDSYRQRSRIGSCEVTGYFRTFLQNGIFWMKSKQRSSTDNRMSRLQVRATRTF